MDMKINSMMEPLGASLKLKSGETPNGNAFANSLSEAFNDVNKMQLEADTALEDLITGKTKNIHETMMTLGKAELAFKLTMQVRNKVMEAYKDVMNTAV